MSTIDEVLDEIRHIAADVASAEVACDLAMEQSISAREAHQQTADKVYELRAALTEAVQRLIERAILIITNTQENTPS